MKISAVLWCKDEVGLLARAVAQLLRSGVATVSITDDGSTDGSATVIDTLCATLPQVHRCPPVLDLQSSLRLDGPIFGPILARDAPDWLLVTDPDEFWIARSGDIRKARALASHDIVVVERFNAALSSGTGLSPRLEAQDTLMDLPLLLDRTPLNAARMAENPELRWISHRINPKLLVRPDRVLEFGLGMHDVSFTGDTPLRRARGQDMVVAHLPFTDYARFERKVANIAGVFDRFDANHTGNIAWHWRRWLDLARRGALRAEYDRQFFAPETLAEMQRAGKVASATEIFARRRAEAAARRATAGPA